MNSEQHSARLARWVHWCLLLGLIASAISFVMGLLIVLIVNEPRPDGAPQSLQEMLSAAARGSGLALLQLGCVLLMLTPVLRVVVLGIGWSLDRQWRFAATAVVVLVLLGISVLMGAV